MTAATSQPDKDYGGLLFLGIRFWNRRFRTKPVEAGKAQRRKPGQSGAQNLSSTRKWTAS
jgi:hypothetical protein